MPPNITTPEQLSEALEAAKRSTILARSLVTEMDAELAKVKARFEPKINSATAEVDGIARAVQSYAGTNREALFAEGLKSTKINGHTLGFRDTPGAIKMAKGTTEKKFLERLSRVKVLKRLFVRTKPSLDKEAMLSRWAVWGKKLAVLGARLKKEEVFFLELDVTEDPAAKVADGKAAQ